ncbi:DUF1571 domain-containing protein [Neorhodopirellula pilleata]|uniref:Uncharacterized protein n=1 Tax=Neorhodopirellula pilleata TaxID=2714738 RepID=A0A5C6ASZ9_9BACT|nr:DUF1571 domain-containing protein [Neorhodopirellula pilleata]TWU03125.1 hypothetical protein Pla100_00430 [Neorhodopirellula pilleata]
MSFRRLSPPQPQLAVPMRLLGQVFICLVCLLATIHLSADDVKSGTNNPRPKTSESKTSDNKPNVERTPAKALGSEKSTDVAESLDAVDPEETQAMNAKPIDMIGPGARPPESLEPLIELARRAKEKFETTIDAYTCLIVKQETIDGKLDSAQYLRLKVRDRRVQNGQLIQPLSIYAKFLKPEKVAGREVLYVENQLDGDLLVRRGGSRLPNLTLKLDPDGRLARKDTNYSITQTGIRPMLQQILDRMETQPADCPIQIRLFADAKVDGRSCQHIEIRQLKQTPQSDFQIAKVYIDDEWQLPVYFASYAWPGAEGGEPVLQEQYVITKINLEAELTDLDFDRANPAYRFRTEDEEDEDEAKDDAAPLEK